MNLFELVLRNLRKRPTRSGLTVLAVAIGIAAVVALTGIAWGFEASWQHANDARGTDLIVTRSSSENAMPSPFAAGPLLPVLKAYPHVTQVVGLLSEMLTVNENTPPLFVFGWAYPSYLWAHLKKLDGRWPVDDQEPVVMLGELASELLHKKTGDGLELEGRSFHVIGVFESAALVENGAVLMTLGQMQDITDKHGKVNVLNIKLDVAAGEEEIASFKATVRKTLPGYVAITSGELVRDNIAVRISKAMSHATILIASLVGALMVFNTMLMSVNERTREIGILQALGWQRRTILKLIIAESALLALLGGALGIVLGMGLTLGLEQVDLMRGKIDAVFSWHFLLEVLLLSVILGILGGLYPALKAARLRPAQALRQE